MVAPGYTAGTVVCMAYDTSELITRLRKITWGLTAEAAAALEYSQSEMYAARCAIAKLGGEVAEIERFGEELADWRRTVRALEAENEQLRSQVAAATGGFGEVA